MGKLLTVEAVVGKPVSEVWAAYTTPEHVMQWNHASDDWHCPKASNDLRTGGSFSYTMAAKDGSFSFDFGGMYKEVVAQEKLDVVLGDDLLADGRIMVVTFAAVDGGTHVVTQFTAEDQNPEEMQIAGWQMILNNFKAYAESL